MHSTLTMHEQEIIGVSLSKPYINGDNGDNGHAEGNVCGYGLCSSICCPNVPENTPLFNYNMLSYTCSI